MKNTGVKKILIISMMAISFIAMVNKANATMVDLTGEKKVLYDITSFKKNMQIKYPFGSKQTVKITSNEITSSVINLNGVWDGSLVAGSNYNTIPQPQLKHKI